MKRMEAIVYHIAKGNIDEELLLPIIQAIIACTDFSESLKISITEAIRPTQKNIEDNV